MPFSREAQSSADNGQPQPKTHSAGPCRYTVYTRFSDFSAELLKSVQEDCRFCALSRREFAAGQRRRKRPGSRGGTKLHC